MDHDDVSEYCARLISAADTYPLRQAVLRPGQPIETCHFKDDDMPETFHLGLFEGDKLVSISSYMQESLPGFAAEKPFRLRGMATDSNYRGQGLGTLLLEAAFNELLSRYCDFLWCQARVKAIPFYERLGFIVCSDEYMTPNGPHKTMYKVLNSR